MSANISTMTTPHALSGSGVPDPTHMGAAIAPPTKPSAADHDPLAAIATAPMLQPPTVDGQQQPTALPAAFAVAPPPQKDPQEADEEPTTPAAVASKTTPAEGGDGGSDAADDADAVPADQRPGTVGPNGERLPCRLRRGRDLHAWVASEPGIVFVVPMSDVLHLPPGKRVPIDPALTQLGLRPKTELCPDFVKHGSCERSGACDRIHADLARARRCAPHVRDTAWRAHAARTNDDSSAAASLPFYSEQHYARLPEGHTLSISFIPSVAEKVPNATPVVYPADECLVTASRGLMEMIGGTSPGSEEDSAPATPMNGVVPAFHCLHFLVKGVCHLGAECRFAHVAHGTPELVRQMRCQNAKGLTPLPREPSANAAPRQAAHHHHHGHPQFAAGGVHRMSPSMMPPPFHQFQQQQLLNARVAALHQQQQQHQYGAVPMPGGFAAIPAQPLHQHMHHHHHHAFAAPVAFAAVPAQPPAGAPTTQAPPPAWMSAAVPGGGAPAGLPPPGAFPMPFDAAQGGSVPLVQPRQGGAPLPVAAPVGGVSATIGAAGPPQGFVFAVPAQEQ